MSKAGKGSQGVEQVIKLIVGAGKASPGPPVGPALGSKGVKSMDFCKVSQLVQSLNRTVPLDARGLCLSTGKFRG